MHPRHRVSICSLVWVVTSAACGGEGKKADPAERVASAPAPASETAKPKAADKPFAAIPKAEPPPAPIGSVAVPSPWRYVQICDEKNPCPELLQTQGELHCRDFGLAGLTSGWRLPSKSEMGAWASISELKQLEGYHRTRTPFDEDPMQAWIVDPSGEAQATTIPRKRKPFRIRCVYEP